MTVCVAVQVRDCIVFAADSATSLLGVDGLGQPVVANVYNHGKKVFCLHKRLPVMAMTCGMGSIAGSSIDVLAKDFRLLLMDGGEMEGGGTWLVDPSAYTMEEIAKKARRYFCDDQYISDPNRPQGAHSFELYLAGHSAGQRHGETWKISIVNGVITGPTPVVPCGATSIVYSGQPEAINRLVLGYSAALPGILESAGVQGDALTQLLQAIQAQTQAQLVSPAMPVQDAIDLAQFLVSTTIDFTKFLPGANTVGGAIDVATVTRHEGFKWVRRKHYYASQLNPLETDHVGGR
jgi:hypothetical protein